MARNKLAPFYGTQYMWTGREPIDERNICYFWLTSAVSEVETNDTVVVEDG